MEKTIKIASAAHPDISLKMIPGHFVTPSSHVNYYLDMATLKSRQTEASAVALAMSSNFSATTVIDTIVCLDGCEVIGAYLAEDLTKAGVLSQNAHKAMYIVSPEYSASGQIIFRENNTPMIKDRNILIILSSITTGDTITRAAQAINYYGGTVVGINAIFSAARKIEGLPIMSVFSTSDIPDYQTHRPENCPFCKSAKKIDALANGFGYSKV